MNTNERSLSEKQKKILQEKFIKKHQRLFDLLAYCHIVDMAIIHKVLNVSERTVRKWINEQTQKEIEKDLDGKPVKKEKIYNTLLKKTPTDNNPYYSKYKISLTDRAYYLMDLEPCENKRKTQKQLKNAEDKIMEFTIKQNRDDELEKEIREFIDINKDKAAVKDYYIEYDAEKLFKNVVITGVQVDDNEINANVIIPFTHNYDDTIGDITERVLSIFEILIADNFRDWGKQKDNKYIMELNIDLKIISTDGLNVTALERATKHHRRQYGGGFIHNKGRFKDKSDYERKLRKNNMDIYYLTIFNQINKYYIFNTENGEITKYY